MTMEFQEFQSGKNLPRRYVAVVFDGAYRIDRSYWDEWLIYRCFSRPDGSVSMTRVGHADSLKKAQKLAEKHYQQEDR